MPRLSLAASLRAALLGLTVVLAVLAAFGVSALYGSRQDYEDRLSDGLQLQAAASRVLAAGVVEEATLRLSADGTAGADARARARAAFDATLDAARVLAAGDPQSLALVDRARSAQADVRRSPGSRSDPLAARAPLVRLSGRQDDRITAARQSASDDARRAFLTIIAGGGLAVLAAAALVTLLVRSVRRPLDALVAASGRLAGGRRDVRVPEDGPEELMALARSFNAMAADVQDAAARVEAERRRLELTIRSLGDALVILGPDGAVTAANPRAAELVPALSVGTQTGTDAVALPVALHAALTEETTVEHGPLTLAITAAPLEDGAGHVVTVRDVSERARLERLKSEFAATASHELRSPLTSIKGFVELLIESDGLTPRQRDFLDIVSVSTNRLVELVNDLLDVTRVEAGAIELHPRPTDMAELAREVAQLLRPRAQARDQQLVVDVAADLPRALVDPARVRQILTNLLTNAHLYTPDGGRLTVAARAEGLTLVVEVADTGRGMTAEDAERVFERFFRTGGDDGAGTGLGLAIVRSLVDLHGGDIAVRSAPGRGTTFTVRFPLALQSDRLHAARDALHGKRVLVVDDEPEIAALITDRLRQAGVVVDIATDGSAALDRLRERRYDAMTLDILMPQTDGLETLRALRADPGLAALPVVVVSVFSGREALSGEWVVAKPIDPEELVDTLGAALLAARVRVLAVARPAVRDRLTGTLDDLGIDHDWVEGPQDVAAACRSRYYEVAIVDAGLPDTAAAVAALDLRGRRTGHTVLLATDGEAGHDGNGAHDAVVGSAQAIALDDAGAVILGLLGSAGPDRGLADPTDDSR